MADVFDQAKRSEIMSRVKGRGNAATELRLIRLLREHGIKGWRRGFRLFGKPDFVFPRARLAVFIDGEFWHGHPTRGTIPATNQRFWSEKITRNIRRDQTVNDTLKSTGWKVLRLWQHELRSPEAAIQRVQKALGSVTRSGKVASKRARR